MKAYFVSDIHLKNPDEPSAQVFEKFLRGLSEKKPTHLFLVGDIFDLWIGSHDYFRNRFEAIVDAIRTLVRDGVRVHFFEGNHDLHLEKFWADEIGAEVHTDGERFELGNLSVLVEHGDLINPNDKGYLFLRWLLRTKAVRLLAENLPSKLVKEIGERASQASREYTSSHGPKGVSTDEVRAMIRTFAEKRYAEQPFDLIVTGHVHVMDDYKFNVGEKEARSINLGSWFDGARYLMLSDQSGEVMSGAMTDAQSKTTAHVILTELVELSV